MIKPIEVPVVLPSKIPDKNSTVSGSLRCVTILDCPGLRLFNSFWIASKSTCNPAGNPSMIPPIAVPWDSPYVVTFNKFPKELNDIIKYYN